MTYLVEGPLTLDVVHDPEEQQDVPQEVLIHRMSDRHPSSVDVAELEILGLQHRAELAIRDLDLSEEATLQIYAGWELAERVHEGEQRANKLPYIQHPMRAMIRSVEDFGIEDPDFLTAAFLHDTLEDNPEGLILFLEQRTNDPQYIEEIKILGKVNPAEARERAHRLLSEHFSEKVAGLVLAVSNPILPLGHSKREKLATYDEHTYQITEGPLDVTLLKLADFYDNACRNDTTPKLDKRLQADLKYRPHYDLYVARLEKEIGTIEEMLAKADQDIDLVPDKFRKIENLKHILTMVISGRDACDERLTIGYDEEMLNKVLKNKFEIEADGKREFLTGRLGAQAVNMVGATIGSTLDNGRV